MTGSLSEPVPRALVRARVTSAGFAPLGDLVALRLSHKETVSAPSGHQSPRSGAPTARGVFINSLSSSVNFTVKRNQKKYDFVAAVGEVVALQDILRRVRERSTCVRLAILR